MADVTTSVVRLGNPAGTYNGAQTYARNVWDMQSYGGLLYIGSGNSDSAHTSGPPFIDVNAGPRPVIVFDPGTGLFTTEGTSGAGGTLNTEQIDTFRVIDFGGSEGTQLVVPEHDPRADSNLGFYALKSGTWRRHAASGSLGTPQHTYDCVPIGTKLIAGGGNIGYSQALSAWNNSGGEATTFMTGDGSGGSRGWSAFVLGGKGYIAGSIMADDSEQHLCEVNSGATAVTQLGHTFSTIFPSTSSGEVVSDQTPDEAVIRRPVNFGTSLVFVGASKATDHQWSPFGLYSVDEVSGSGGLDSATFARLTLPNSAVPYDLLVDGATLYVLGAHTSGSDTVVGVYSTTDLSSWAEQFTFTPNDVDTGTQGQTFARSFEKLSDIWYFGLGSDLGTQPANVGDILSFDGGAVGDWPMAGANPQRTAYQSSETLTPPFSVAWTHAFAVVTGSQTIVEKLHPSVSAIVSNGHVLVPTLMGYLHSFVTGTSKTREWSATVGAPVVSTPVADGTNVYVADIYGRLSAFKLSDGTAASGWTNPIQVTDYGPIQGSLLLAEGMLMFGDAAGTFHFIDPADGSDALSPYDAGTPILQGAAGDGAGKVVVGCMDGTVLCLDTSDGSLEWRTSALAGAAGFPHYWPVIVGSKVITRPMSRYYYQATTDIEIAVDDPTDDSQMTAALADYDANVADYKKSLYVLDLTDGSDDASNQVIHWHARMTMNGSPPPVALDKDGYIVTPVGDDWMGGWGRISLTTRKIVDILREAGDPTYAWGNPDENICVSTCSNGIEVMHIQELNAQPSAFWKHSDSTWHPTFNGVGQTTLFTNTQGGGANPAAISGGMIYHAAHPHTLVAWEGS